MITLLKNGIFRNKNKIKGSLSSGELIFSLGPDIVLLFSMGLLYTIAIVFLLEFQTGFGTTKLQQFRETQAPGSEFCPVSEMPPSTISPVGIFSRCLIYCMSELAKNYPGKIPGFRIEFDLSTCHCGYKCENGTAIASGSGNFKIFIEQDVKTEDGED